MERGALPVPPPFPSPSCPVLCFLMLFWGQTGRNCPQPFLQPSPGIAGAHT